jgi:hypothetical protein
MARTKIKQRRGHPPLTVDTDRDRRDDEDANEVDQHIDYEIPDAMSAAGQSRSKSPAIRPTSSVLLEALKEELFELEVERKQGHLSQEEYEKAKSALDQTLERALKREAATKQI